MIKTLKFMNAWTFRFCDTRGFHLTIYWDWPKRLFWKLANIFDPQFKCFHVFFDIEKCSDGITTCEKYKEK